MELSPYLIQGFDRLIVAFSKTRGSSRGALNTDLSTQEHMVSFPVRILFLRQVSRFSITSNNAFEWHSYSSRVLPVKKKNATRTEAGYSRNTGNFLYLH